jgi:hypothetical protein
MMYASLPVRGPNSRQGSYHLRFVSFSLAGPRLCTSPRGLRGLQGLHLRALSARLREMLPPRRRGDPEER